MTEPFAIEDFGGLNLRDDATNMPGYAVDLLDVDFSDIGTIRTRPGMAAVGSALSPNANYQAHFPAGTNSGEFVLIRTDVTGAPVKTYLDTCSLAGTLANVGSFNTTALTAPWSFAAIGTPTTSAVYVSLYDRTTPAGVTLRKYDGATLGTGTGKPQFVATWPPANRLVQGSYLAAADSPSGANGSFSTVFFSDPGAPDTYGANNYVQVRPGDGEQITVIVAWQDLLFVFKQTAVFVFTGEGTDSAGNPRFNYRRIDLPDRMVPPIGFQPFACAGPDGVYFAATGGIYRIAYGGPELVSGMVDPLFRSNTDVSSALRLSGHTPPFLSIAGGRLYARYTNADGTNRTLVLNLATGQWSVWTILGTGFFTAYPSLSGSASLANTVTKDLVATTVGSAMAAVSPSTTTDLGSAISWSYTSGRYDMGQPGRVKITLESKIVGAGSVALQVATRGATQSSAGVFDTGSTVTLGTAPIADEGWQQIDREGSSFQHKLSGTGLASVTELVHYLSFIKPAGVS